MNRSRSLLLGAVGLSLWGCTRWGYEALPDVDGTAGDSSSLGTGASSTGDGGTGTGGKASSGGSATGSTSSGGGGASGGGGVTSGGASTGGVASGGAATGGAATGGSGGAASGGASTGGAASGGAATGGAGTGGMAALTIGPLTSFLVTPGAREPGQLFSMDASATTDLEDPVGSLTFEWDFDNDGVYDATGVTTTHAFSTPSTYMVTLRATDTSGAYATTTRAVAVAAAGELVLVDTSSTTATSGATPGSPGPDGLLSLPEAVAYVNGRAGKQVILVQSGLNIVLASTATLSAAGGDSLVGYGATLDGWNLSSSPCIDAWSAGGLVAGLNMINCPTRGVEVFSSNVTVANCTVKYSSTGFFVSTGLTGVTIGPGNDVSTVTGYGVQLSGPAVVTGNRFVDTGSSGALVMGGANGSSMYQNQFIRNGQFNIDLANQIANATIAHNLLQDAAVHSLGLGNSTAATFDNNTLVSATNWGIPVDPANFTSVRNNLFFGNGTGTCKCTLDASNLQVDPQYVNPAADDYRPGLTSPLIDAARGSSFDTNGTAPGFFNGASPDIGYYETP
jgi:hypothetical protein